MSNLSASSTVYKGSYQHLLALALIVHDVKLLILRKWPGSWGTSYSARCNQLLFRSITAMTAVKMYHTSTDKNR